MKRNYFKEAITLLITIIFFDIFRLYFVIRNNYFTFLDVLWLIILISILVLTILSYDKKLIPNLLAILLSFLPIVIFLIDIIEVITCGYTFESHLVFKIFEIIPLIINNIFYIIDYSKAAKDE